MKKIAISFLFLLGVLAVNIVFAQAPNKFKYQAVLRDASGNIVASTAQTVNVTILQGGFAGTPVYEETHSTTTTAQGIINLNIGDGTPISGSIAGIDWGSNTYWIKITIGATVISNTQLLSVPYALNAASSSSSQWLNGAAGAIYYPGGNVQVTNNHDLQFVAPSGSPNDPGDVAYFNYDGTQRGRIWMENSSTGGMQFLAHTGGTPQLYLSQGGNLGIGTLAPTQKLDVDGTIRIRGGSPGADKLLRSDASGNASWVTIPGNTPAVLGSLSATTYSWTTGTPVYTGTTLTLPPGKWSVQVCILIPNTSGLECWVRSTFTDGSGTSTSSGDIIGSSLASGYKAANSFGLIIGTIIINNTSGSNKTYYYWGGTCDTYAGSFSLSNFGTSLSSENQIIAYPMN